LLNDEVSVTPLDAVLLLAIRRSTSEPEPAQNYIRGARFDLSLPSQSVALVSKQNNVSEI